MNLSIYEAKKEGKSVQWQVSMLAMMDAKPFSFHHSRRFTTHLRVAVQTQGGTSSQCQKREKPSIELLPSKTCERATYIREPEVMLS